MRSFELEKLGNADLRFFNLMKQTTALEQIILPPQQKFMLG